MNEWASIISTVGFPIASFLLSAYWIKYNFDKQLEKEQKAADRDEKHWEEISKLTSAVNNNTKVLYQFVKLETEKEEGGNDS